jgi:hypothetical protein
MPHSRKTRHREPPLGGVAIQGWQARELCNQARTCSPCLRMTVSSLRAMPLGRLAPVSHFSTVFRCVEVAGEYRLTDVVGLADLLDFSRLSPARQEKMTCVKVAHRRLVERTNLVEHRRRPMDRRVPE